MVQGGCFGPGSAAVGGWTQFGHHTTQNLRFWRTPLPFSSRYGTLHAAITRMLWSRFHASTLHPNFEPPS